MFEAYIVGIFPRNDYLASVWKRWERGDIPQEVLINVIDESIEKVVELQISNGLTYIHDPLIDWHDILRPFTDIEGIKVGPITRFFENNTFYKKPIIGGEVKYEEGHILSYIHSDKLPKGRRWIISLPGPYTFYVLSEAKDAGEAVDSISRVISGAAEDLLNEGYEFINFLEPALAYYNDIDWEKVYRLYREVHDLGIRYRIHLFFGDIGEKIRYISKICVNGFSIDASYTNIFDINTLNTDTIVLGIIDAQNTLLEDPDDIASKVNKFVEQHNVETVAITPNTDLDYLPYDYAVKKVGILGDVLRRLER